MLLYNENHIAMFFLKKSTVGFKISMEYLSSLHLYLSRDDPTYI